MANEPVDRRHLGADDGLRPGLGGRSGGRNGTNDGVHAGIMTPRICPFFLAKQGQAAENHLTKQSLTAKLAGFRNSK